MSVSGIEGKFIVLTPTTQASVPNGAMFLDTDDSDLLKTKDTSGSVSTLTTGASPTNILLKSAIAGGAITALRTVSKRADGKTVQADSDSADGQAAYGIALDAASADGDPVNVVLFGPNVANALNGLGFAPGDDIYLSETGGYTNTNSFTGDNDSIIKVGVADCAAGIASATATDLICFAEVISRP